MSGVLNEASNFTLVVVLGMDAGIIMCQCPVLIGVCFLNALRQQRRGNIVGRMYVSKTIPGFTNSHGIA